VKAFRAAEILGLHFGDNSKDRMKRLLAVLALAAAPAAFAQTCPEKNLMYWQAFPAGGNPTFRRGTSSSC